MIKVLDKELEEVLMGIIEEEKDSMVAASEVVVALKGIQDASGMKICTAVTKGDPCLKELK